MDIEVVAERLDLPPSAVRRLLADVAGVHVEGDLVCIDQELLDAVQRGLGDGQMPLTPAEIQRGRRGRRWALGAPHPCRAAAPAPSR